MGVVDDCEDDAENCDDELDFISFAPNTKGKATIFFAQSVASPAAAEAPKATDQTPAKVADSGQKPSVETATS